MLLINSVCDFPIKIDCCRSKLALDNGRPRTPLAVMMKMTFPFTFHNLSLLELVQNRYTADDLRRGHEMVFAFLRSALDRCLREVSPVSCSLKRVE
jgi:hypothetical protein